MEKEIRLMSTMEIRAAEEGETPKIIGYAARFNELSEVIMGIFRERIRPGAFTSALKTSDVRALFNHDPNYVLGRTTNGTLVLTEDEIGLRYEIAPPDTQWARDLVASIKRGDINQSSFAFTVAREEWDDKADPAIREIIEFDQLYDVSPVTYPAYPTTSVGVRSAEDVYKAHKAQTSRADKAEEKSQSRLSVLRKKLNLLEKTI